MKSLNKRELIQIAYNHLSDIASKGFLNLYKKCTEKAFSYLLIGHTFQKQNFRRNIKTNHEN